MSQKKAERAELLRKAQAVINGAKASNREFTASEEKQVEGWFSEIEKIDEHITAAKSADAIMARLGGQVPLDPWDSGDRERGSFGFDTEKVKTDLASAIRSKSSFGFDAPLRKAAITAGPLTLPASGTGVADTPPGDSVFALRDLLNTQATESATVRYYRLGLGSGADVVAEGALKPELVSSIDSVDAAVQKLAVTFKFSDELAEDAQFLIEYILREATRAVLRRENRLILDAFNTAPGILTSTSTQALVLDTLAGAIGAAEATNGISPNRIVAHPVDLAHLRLIKSSGSGEYVSDPLSAGPTTIHGVPVTSTPAATPGAMWLLAPGVGTLYTRGLLRIESGFVADDWQRNLVSTRVEERILPAIVRPSLATKITLT